MILTTGTRLTLRVVLISDDSVILIDSDEQLHSLSRAVLPDAAVDDEYDITILYFADNTKLGE